MNNKGPIFIQLRMELLDVESPLYPMLMRSLYGLLMLLPQSTAYKTLRDRLVTACRCENMVGAIFVMQPRQWGKSINELPLLLCVRSRVLGGGGRSRLAGYYSVQRCYYPTSF